MAYSSGDVGVFSGRGKGTAKFVDVSLCARVVKEIGKKKLVYVVMQHKLVPFAFVTCFCAFLHILYDHSNGHKSSCHQCSNVAPQKKTPKKMQVYQSKNVQTIDNKLIGYCTLIQEYTPPSLTRESGEKLEIRDQKS